MADYDLPALGNVNMGYILSALLGIVLVGIMVWLLMLLVTGGSGRQKQKI